MSEYSVYIMANLGRTLYVGMTSNLERRVYQHKTNYFPKSFSARYNIGRLVYFESFGDAEGARAREKQIKGWGRKKKIRLIDKTNPEWRDLSEAWGGTEL